MQLLRGLRIFGVHVHHEVGVCGEQRHLPLRVATVGAVRVGLNELPDSETVGSFRDGDRDVLAHEISSDFEDGPSFEKRMSTRTSCPIDAAMSTSSKSNPPPSALRTSAFTSGLPTDAGRCVRPQAEAVCGHVALPLARIVRSPLRRWNLPADDQYVQDIFTIEAIAIKYRNGATASKIFRCRRGGAALRACGGQAARRAACALATNSGPGGGSRFQTVLTSAARREAEGGREGVPG